MGTAPKVAAKPPLKRSYPMTTLEKLREKTREQAKGQGTSSSSRVIEVVETVPKEDHENLKKMKKAHPRMKPMMRGQSEIFRRSRSYWLERTRKVSVDEEDAEKGPVKLEPRKKVCMEECKIKVTHKGK